MSWHVVAAVTSRRVGSHARRLLLVTMADKANKDGSGIYASVATLARESEIADRTVQRLLREFQQEGLIHFVGTRPCRGGRTNEYDIALEAVERLPLIENENVQREAVSGDTVSPVTGSHPNDQRRPPAAHTMARGDTVSPAPGRHPSGDTVSPKPIQEPFSLTSKEVREKAPPTAKEKIKPHSMPEDWTPAPATRDYAKRLGFSDWEIDAAAIECRDFWLDRPATKRPGWERTLQNRLRDLKEDPKARAKLKHVKPGADAAVSEAVMRHRLNMFNDDGYWNDKWGPRPTKKPNGHANGAHP